MGSLDHVLLLHLLKAPPHRTPGWQPGAREARRALTDKVRGRCSLSSLRIRVCPRVLRRQLPLQRTPPYRNNPFAGGQSVPAWVLEHPSSVLLSCIPVLPCAI